MASDITRLVAATILAALMAVVAPAYAEPTEAEKESARTLMDEGDKRVALRDYEGALRSYQAADAIMHVPTTTVEVAKTLAVVGRLLDAREAARTVLAHPRQPEEPAPFTQARREAEVLLEALTRAIPQLVVHVRGVARGEEVAMLVDGSPRQPGATLELEPGTHRIVATAPGRAREERALSLPVGSRISVELELHPADAGRTQPPPPPAMPTAHKVAIAGFALGAAGLAVGGVTGLLSWSRTSDLEDRCRSGCPASAEGDLDTANTLANVSNVGFVLAAVGVTTGIVALVVAPRSRSARTGTARGLPAATFRF